MLSKQEKRGAYMEENLQKTQLTQEELMDIVRNIPDSISVYDRNGELVVCSNLVLESNARKVSMLETEDAQVRAQIQQSDAEMEQAIDYVLNTGESMSFIRVAPHFINPSLYTIRPIQDKDGAVKFVVANGRSQAVINKFSKEYYKLQQSLELGQESLRLLSQLHLRTTDIVAESPAMRRILKTIQRVAQTDSTVTITGESGTGKEVIANAIHQNSTRKDGIFVPVNCSAIPPELMESEFFGYTSGAFTGARSGGRVGLFELANHGTLFLDEIGELSLSLQSKLLRALESGEIRPVGSSQAKKVDVRIIAATNRNLEEMVQNKEFREDLFYRLQIIPLYLPPLRDRKEDIIPLAEHYLQVYNKKHHRSCYLANSAKEELLRYNWPGNIRELRNLMERIVIISEVDAIVQMNILAQKATAHSDQLTSTEWPENFYDAVAQFETAYIDQMIHTCHGDVSKAAERMGVHKSMIYKRLKKTKEE